MTSSDARGPRRDLRRCSALLIATLALTAASTASAQQTQPSAADLESARALFKQGKDLRATGNPADVRAALDKFTAAYTYAATPLTALELGRTQAALGQLVEARETLLSVARLKVQSDETDKSAAARSEAADLAEQLRPRIPGVSVKVQSAAPEGKTTLTVDGSAVTIVAGTATRKLNPGEHVLVAKAGAGPDAQKTVTLKEGEMQEVLLAPSYVEGPATPPVVNTPVPRGAEPPLQKGGGGTGRTLVVIGAVAGGVGVAVGSVTGVLALSKASSVKDACPDKSRCTSASAQSDYKTGRTMGTLSTVSFIVAGAGAATLLAGLLIPGSSPKTGGSGVRIEPQVGLLWAGVNGAF